MWHSFAPFIIIFVYIFKKGAELSKLPSLKLNWGHNLTNNQLTSYFMYFYHQCCGNSLWDCCPDCDCCQDCSCGEECCNCCTDCANTICEECSTCCVGCASCTACSECVTWCQDTSIIMCGSKDLCNCDCCDCGCDCCDCSCSQPQCSSINCCCCEITIKGMPSNS